MLDMDKVLRYAEMLFTFVEAAARSGLMQGAMPGADAIYDDQTSVLKLVLAITLVMEGGGKDPLGEKLFENVQRVIERIMSGLFRWDALRIKDDSRVGPGHDGGLPTPGP